MSPKQGSIDTLILVGGRERAYRHEETPSQLTRGLSIILKGPHFGGIAVLRSRFSIPISSDREMFGLSLCTVYPSAWDSQHIRLFYPNMLDNFYIRRLAYMRDTRIP